MDIPEKFSRFWQRLLGKDGKASQTRAEEGETLEVICCSQAVHIAYRGVSDDRQYIAYSRKWSELKFIKPHGLKVFCAQCRRRIHF